MSEPLPLPKALTAIVLTLACPGLGHVYLKRVVRGVVFCLLVLASAAIGIGLEGRLYQPVPGQPLSYLGTAGAMGMGLLYGLLRFAFGYEADISGPTYEYGTAFLITAGLMNLLLVLDVWDIARNGKE